MDAGPTSATSASAARRPPPRRTSSSCIGPKGSPAASTVPWRSVSITRTRNHTPSPPSAVRRSPPPEALWPETGGRRPLPEGATDARPTGPAKRSGLRRAGVEQRQRHVEHPLERDDRDPLGRLVVVLGAVGEVHA